MSSGPDGLSIAQSQAAERAGSYPDYRKAETDKEIISVICVPFPDGSTYWCEEAAHANQAIEQWAEKNPEYADLLPGPRAVLLMPRDKYNAIPASALVPDT